MRQIDPRTDVDVVLMGNDIGVYAMARAFHEQYGIRSTAITRVAAGPVLRSRILHTIELGEDAVRENTLAALEDLGRRSAAAGRTALLLGNSDTFAWMFAEHRDTLNAWYAMPQVSTDTLELISDKASFADLCADLGIDTPRTTVHDFSDADATGWEPTPAGVTYPVIAKPAVSARFEHLSFPGKRKIYKIDSAPELAAEFARIRDAGFRDRFLVQELVPGDDTAMRSITAYVDRAGAVTLLASARVLLQDHTPLGLGNPTAMLTTPLPALTAAARRFLERVDYRGFANFDVKQHPDGRVLFFEVNPRIGRNNHYVTAAGANVARFAMEDLVLGRSVDPVVVDREIAYSVLPRTLVRRYLDGPTRADLGAAIRAGGGLHHPLKYPESLAHRGYTAAAQLNQVKKYRQYYPRATDSGF